MSSVTDVEVLGAADIAALLSPGRAAQAITDALRAGLEPGADPPRSIMAVPAGHLFSMPSASAAAVGIKVATAAPANPARDLPRISAVYLLFDAETLQLRAVLDGTALTNLRTPAVSIAAVTPAFDRFDGPVDVVVFGAGPQAVGHVDALRDSSVVDLGRVSYLVRRPERVPPGFAGEVLAAGTREVAERLAAADVVVCATTARTPVFDADSVRAGAVVIAVGSHEPTAREVPGPLLATAQVIVEDVPTALREAGDIVLAIAETSLTATDLLPMAAVVRREHALEPGRTVVFKGTGMAWEDLVAAEAIVQGRRSR